MSNSPHPVSVTSYGANSRSRLGFWNDSCSTNVTRCSSHDRSSPRAERKYTVHLWLWYSVACEGGGGGGGGGEGGGGVSSAACVPLRPAHRRRPCYSARLFSQIEGHRARHDWDAQRFAFAPRRRGAGRLLSGCHRDRPPPRPAARAEQWRSWGCAAALVSPGVDGRQGREWRCSGREGGVCAHRCLLAAFFAAKPIAARSSGSRHCSKGGARCSGGSAGGGASPAAASGGERSSSARRGGTSSTASSSERPRGPPRRCGQRRRQRRGRAAAVEPTFRRCASSPPPTRRRCWISLACSTRASSPTLVSRNIQSRVCGASPPPHAHFPLPPPPTLRFGPGAVDAVRFLAHERGMQLLVLSNSSRRAAGALANLAKVGRAPLTGAECGRAPLARPTRTPLSGARRWGLTVRHLRAWSPAGR